MPKSKQKYTFTTFLALFAAESLWGFNNAFIKLGLRTIPLAFYLAVTLIGAALAIVPLAIKHWKPMNKKDYALLTIGSLIGISLGNVVLLMGLKLVFVFSASLISLLKPLLLMILSVQFLKEKFSLKTFYGILIAFAGAAIVVLQPWHSGSNEESLGLLLILLAAFCDVIGTIILKPVASRSDPYQLTTLHLLIGATPIALYALIHIGSVHLGAFKTAGWLSILENIFAIAVANTLFYFGLKYRKVQNTGIFQYVYPVATLIGGWIVLSEVPNARVVIGAVIIAVGIYVAEFYKKDKMSLKRIR